MKEDRYERLKRKREAISNLSLIHIFAEYRHLQPAATTAARYQTDDNSVTLIANGVAATFNKTNGNLVEVKNGSKVIPLSLIHIFQNLLPVTYTPISLKNWRM